MEKFIDLTDKVALVTGASRGIGREIALTLAKAGSNVVVNYSKSEEQAKELVDKLNSLGSKAIAIRANVHSEDQVIEMVNKIVLEFKTIDILVNNAGITRDSLIARMSISDWEDVLNVCLKGAFLCSKYISRIMIRKRSGAIVNISSVVGVRGNPGQVNYSSAKAGLIGLTKSLARELAPRGVRVNAIAPGYIKTELTDRLSETVREKILKAIPLGYLGETKDVANSVLFLVSDLARYITGHVLLVDGGMGM